MHWSIQALETPSSATIRSFPGTRKQLRDRLEGLLINKDRQHNMIWLRGPADTAVAQTFAEYADEHDALGATFFFSRPNNRDNPLQVVPTLAYQLAEKDDDYMNPLTRRLALKSRSVLRAALRTQLKKLIVEPFAILAWNSADPRESLIVLDGLDECQGEDVQC